RIGGACEACSHLIQSIAKFSGSSRGKEEGELFEAPENGIEFPGFFGPQGREEESAVGIAGQQSLRFELDEGLADGGAADAEFGGQGRVVDAGVLLPAAVEEQAKEGRVDLLAEGEAEDGGRSHAYDIHHMPHRTQYAIFNRFLRRGLAFRSLGGFFSILWYQAVAA